MAILVDSRTRLVVQGLTGREGRFHALRNREYGTAVVAGVTPGKAGQDVEGIPVFNTVASAVAETGANTSLIFVPARFAVDALDRLGEKVPVPLVVRLDGTNAEEGRALLAGSPSDRVVPAATMLDAARKAVELAGAGADTKAGA